MILLDCGLLLNSIFIARVHPKSLVPPTINSMREKSKKIFFERFLDVYFGDRPTNLFLLPPDLHSIFDRWHSYVDYALFYFHNKGISQMQHAVDDLETNWKDISDSRLQRNLPSGEISVWDIVAQEINVPQNTSRNQKLTRIQYLLQNTSFGDLCALITLYGFSLVPFRGDDEAVSMVAYSKEKLETLKFVLQITDQDRSSLSYLVPMMNVDKKNVLTQRTKEEFWKVFEHVPLPANEKLAIPIQGNFSYGNFVSLLSSYQSGVSLSLLFREKDFHLINQFFFDFSISPKLLEDQRMEPQKAKLKPLPIVAFRQKPTDPAVILPEANILSNLRSHDIHREEHKKLLLQHVFNLLFDSTTQINMQDFLLSLDDFPYIYVYLLSFEFTTAGFFHSSETSIIRKHLYDRAQAMNTQTKWEISSPQNKRWQIRRFGWKYLVTQVALLLFQDESVFLDPSPSPPLFRKHIFLLKNLLQTLGQNPFALWLGSSFFYPLRIQGNVEKLVLGTWHSFVFSESIKEKVNLQTYFSSSQQWTLVFFKIIRDFVWNYLFHHPLFLPHILDLQPNQAQTLSVIRNLNLQYDRQTKEYFFIDEKTDKETKYYYVKPEFLQFKRFSHWSREALVSFLYTFYNCRLQVIYI